MDDFGTGYSSMSYLSYIPAEAVKLDRSLIDTYVRREGENEFIRDIIVLLHDLGKTVIAEGVEQAWQRDILRRCSCDVIQGYYYSKPLPAEDIPACIQRFA
jgi:EAL domain-containing protein (putative c-di-GMP-specific phosphodiesterase class I)